MGSSVLTVGCMTLLVHSHKYDGSPHLSSPLELPDLHVEHRRLEPRSLKPVTFTCHAIAVALKGRTPVRRTANGETHRGLIRPGMGCIEPTGFDEIEAEI